MGQVRDSSKTANKSPVLGPPVGKNQYLYPDRKLQLAIVRVDSSLSRVAKVIEDAQEKLGRLSHQIYGLDICKICSSHDNDNREVSP